ncbi:RNA polymerase III RPC4-domain-containing protein [Cristinia sonorae]|uniref:RNA polymerase III RPC4-domain-containing protein n=1 Tax=Cristinia sonorae TaxID=1940300 RepID=A0A8K0XML4_9AGAR|nr:RNA polymerase III RPC4-domain-containing protein [Cristinia sonorae]
MAEHSGSSNSASGAGNSTPKAIASLAKKPTDTTRLGTQKLKFVPTLPARRKKEDVKVEEAPAPATSERGRGRGRGADRARGRGRGGEGRGGAPRPAVEMVASGPFAMGPAMAGTSARRTAPRSNFTPIVPQGPGGASKLGAGLTKSSAPSLGVKREPGQENVLAGGSEGRRKAESDEEEVYSDPDEGVEIIDMNHVRTMDWMAPESLKKDKIVGKKKKLKEEPKNLKGKGTAVADAMELDDTPPPKEEANLANAVDLSDSEEEEVLEDIVDDFAVPIDMSEDPDVRQERLYFFQFPEPFPTFISTTVKDEKGKGVAVSPTDEPTGSKKVKFAEDTKPPASGASTPLGTSGAATPQVKKESIEDEPKISGVVGQLEVYQSGVVKIRLGNGILLDVTAATQPSFLQHAVYMDPENKRMCVLGEVNRRFIVSPNLQTLLESMLMSEQPPPSELDDDGLIRMDES